MCEFAHCATLNLSLHMYISIYNNFVSPLKLIFHCCAKPLALGPRVGLEPQYDDFELPIPTCWYLKALHTQCDPTRVNNAQCEPIMPKREPVEYGSRWVHKSWVCVGHVHFMLFVSISFALGIQRKPGFWWNMGLRIE